MSNRRTFLRRSAALGLAALGPTFHGRATGSMYSDAVGHGDFTYRADKKWGALDPQRHPVQHCHEMVMDSRNRLICSSVSLRHDMLVYNKDGKLLDAWKHDLPEPHGLTLAGEGSDQTLWITDTKTGAVVNMDLDGRILRQLDTPPQELLKGKPYKPTETTLTADGDIYVADGYGSNFIFRYDEKGRLRDSFGGSQHFDCCHGITVDHRTDRPTLLITSRAANEFQRWTLDGSHLETYKLPGLSICRPVIDGEQTYFAVIVTRSWSEYDGMLAVLDANMQVVSLPGGSPPVNQKDFHTIEYDNRTFLNPHDVCLDEDKNLYVPQWFSGRTYPIRLKRV